MRTSEETKIRILEGKMIGMFKEKNI